MSYSPTIGRWLEEDPLGTEPELSSGGYLLHLAASGMNIVRADSFAMQDRYTDGMNLYQFAKSNPEGHVDPTGLLVDLVFNRATGELTAKDRDSGKEAKMTPGCAFTGGKNFGISFDPIPVGNYDVLERKDTDGKHTGWYRLDPIDSKPRNDTKDDPGEGQGRDQFRLHPGRRSTGCITIPSDKPDCQKQYDDLRKLINGTKTQNVTDNKYGGNIPDFGVLTVIDQPPTTQPK